MSTWQHRDSTYSCVLCLILINKSSTFPSVLSLRQAIWACTNIPDHLSVKLPPSWGSYNSSHLVIPASVIPGTRTCCAAAFSLSLIPLMSDTNLFISYTWHRPPAARADLAGVYWVPVWNQIHPNTLSTCIKYACDITHAALPGAQNRWCRWRWWVVGLIMAVSTCYATQHYNEKLLKTRQILFYSLNSLLL